MVLFVFKTVGYKIGIKVANYQSSDSATMQPSKFGK
jgi:hypothetical protein